jgi:hypothetical protein
LEKTSRVELFCLLLLARSADVDKFAHQCARARNLEIRAEAMKSLHDALMSRTMSGGECEL